MLEYHKLHNCAGLELGYRALHECKNVEGRPEMTETMGKKSLRKNLIFGGLYNLFTLYIN